MYDQTPRLSTSRLLPAPPGMRYTCAKTLKSQMVDRMITTAKICLSCGTITEKNRRQAPAPSISAASSSSFGTPSRPASTVMATNGKPWCTTLRSTIA